GPGHVKTGWSARSAHRRSGERREPEVAGSARSPLSLGIGESELSYDGNQTATGRGLWYVLHTKSRQEKILADELAARRVEHYLPLIKRPRFYGKRKAVVEEPLFPGYVFLFGDLDHAYVADRTKRVANIITVADQR